MRPELTSFLHLQSYTVLMLAGYFAGFLLARRGARILGLEPRHIDNILLVLLAAVPIGARLFSRMFYMPDLPPGEVWKLWKGGGFVFYGGFIFGLGACLLYAFWQRVPIGKLGDATAPAVALGLALGRIGCLLGGCCWGDACLPASDIARLAPEKVWQVQTWPALCPPNFPLAVRYPPGSDPYKAQVAIGLIRPGDPFSAPVHPVQIYESVLALMLAIGLARLWRVERWRGWGFSALIVGYAGIRFATEFFRADNRPVYWGMTLSQVISLLLAAGCGVVVLSRGRVRLNEKPESPGVKPSSPAVSIPPQR